jgi:polyhydroxybutyrate depolymerase
MWRMVLAVAAVVALGVRAEEGPARREWKIDGVAREALVYAPQAAKSTPSPVVFVFHGHGGTMKNSATKFAVHKYWPEAIVVYGQGLNTKGITDPEGKKPGWQKVAGDYGDRDLKYFDEILGALKKEYKVDEGRVFSMGHSNGGGFTYLLWAVRGDVLAGVGPSSGGGLALVANSVKPKPAFIACGEKDQLVPIDNQRRVIEAAKKVNGCEEKGQEWAHFATKYPSSKGAPLIAYVHPGGHQMPDEVPVLMVKFFKEVGGK